MILPQKSGEANYQIYLTFALSKVFYAEVTQGKTAALLGIAATRDGLAGALPTPTPVCRCATTGSASPSPRSQVEDVLEV
jgi:hypothetical protein